MEAAAEQVSELAIATDPPAAVAIPADYDVGAEKRAAQIPGYCRSAPGAGTITASGAVRHALQGATAHQHMAFARTAARSAEKSYQRVACRSAGRAWARMSDLARLVDLARSDTRQPDPRPLLAPDRPVAIPHANRRACEGGASGNDIGGDYHEHARAIPQSSPHATAR